MKKYVLIDWDDTFSLDGPMFVDIVSRLEKGGFVVKVCTARSSSDPTNVQILKYFKPEGIIFCEGEQKKEFIERHNILNLDEVAFWIDDNPESIVAAEYSLIVGAVRQYSSKLPRRLPYGLTYGELRDTIELNHSVSVIGLEVDLDATKKVILSNPPSEMILKPKQQFFYVSTGCLSDVAISETLINYSLASSA